MEVVFSMYTRSEVADKVSKYKDSELLAYLNRSYWKTQDDISDLEGFYGAHLKRLHGHITAVQEKCPHPSDCCEHNPDPWGSFYSCNICGKAPVRPTPCEEK